MKVRLIMNIFFTETPAVTPYTIAGKLGGNNNPNDPDTVMSPNENNSEYPELRSNGYNSPPNAKIVTPDPPVNAVKNPHKITTINGVPPLIHPNAEVKKFTILLEAPLSAKRYPANVNKGIVGKVGDTTIRYISAGIADTVVKSFQKKSMATPPNPTNMGAPYITDRNKIPKPIVTTQFSP